MKVTIVTPSFNQGRFIGETLASVARQQGVAYEHVIFDAGSSDDTLAVLRRTSPPVRWTSEPDRGQAHAVNKAIAASDGEIIGWLNSDDVYYPDALRTVVAYLAAHPDVDVVYGDADHIDVEGRAFEPYPTGDWDFEALTQRGIICQPAAFFRRAAVERYGALDESLQYAMDYELWLRWARAGARFARMRAKLAGSRLYAENKTIGARVKVHAEINDVLKRTLGRVPDRWLVNYAFAEVAAQMPAAKASRWSVLRKALAASRRWNGGAPGAMFWLRAAAGMMRAITARPPPGR